MKTVVLDDDPTRRCGISSGGRSWRPSSLGASLAAYERWRAEPDQDLADLLRATFGVLADGLRGC
jgi:hypothetical protein